MCAISLPVEAMLIAPREALQFLHVGEVELARPLTAAAGHFIHVYVDRETRRPVAVPDALRNVLQALVMPG